MIRQLILPLLATIGLAGCASSQSVEIKRDHSEQAFTATFDRAFYSQAVDGQLDVILIANGANDSAVDKPLATTSEKSVRQVVHLRVLWQKPRGYRIDNPSANNATITWHVVAGPNDRLTYTGAGWARVSIDDGEADLDIRNATLTIARVVGQIEDPLKRATFAGEVTAKRSDAAVRSYLDEIASYTQSDSATALSGPPARGQAIP